MTDGPVPLDNLIAYVKAPRPDGGPLENVADAFAVSARLDEQSDALIGYFVDQARRPEYLLELDGSLFGGDAAHPKSYVPSKAADLMEGNPQPFSRFTERAARAPCIASQLAAREPLGAGHLAAALLSEPEGLAAKAIAAAGANPRADLRHARHRPRTAGADPRLGGAARAVLRPVRQGGAEGPHEMGLCPWAGFSALTDLADRGAGHRTDR